MGNNKDMGILRVIQVFLGSFYLLLILFYLGIIVPEYFACVNCHTEGAMGIDIWGDQIKCFGDSKAFGKVLFDLSSVIVAGLSTVLIFLFFWKKMKFNNRFQAKKYSRK